MRLEGGGFLVLFEGGGCRVSPRFLSPVSDVNQRKEQVGWTQDPLSRLQGWKDSPQIFCELLKI